jgi:peroxisome-assembly ATPase
MRQIATSVAITDPLVKYQSLLATGLYKPDLAQHRLAHHLQKLYIRLKDYSPAPEQQSRLQQIARAVKTAEGNKDGSDELAVENHPIRRNPLFSKFFQRAESRDSLALTRVLTSHQAALQVNSPKGLFLSGDVGTGKSFLLDLLADGLPTSRKKRWHFNTFMLYTFSRLEHFRKSRPQMDANGQEYSLLWMAKEIVEESPILFLDEFQLPDRAASKILNNLFMAFFQLGGVLVASSNRMPEELEKATGSHYSPPATGGLIDQVLGLGRRQARGELFGQTSDFAYFLEVLKARCDFWHMEGARDWRREKSNQSSNPAAVASGGVEVASQLTTESQHDVSEDTTPLGDDSQVLSAPAMYFLQDDNVQDWDQALASCLGTNTTDLETFRPASLIVYGRQIMVPRQRDGVSYWRFEELVGAFGPADYITLAANYHTFIIDRMPALTVLMKNEARRFITLLDALYEARCKLVVRAEAPPDNLFFPETRRAAKSANNNAVATKPSQKFTRIKYLPSGRTSRLTRRLLTVNIIRTKILTSDRNLGRKLISETPGPLPEKTNDSHTNERLADYGSCAARIGMREVVIGGSP